MDDMKIRVFHAGRVRVSPYLPYGGDKCSIIKAAGLTTPKRDWLWLPVSAYLIEHQNGRILVDTGWSRDMSPDGVFDAAAQIRSLGSPLLYMTNQGVVGKDEAIDEQLSALGIAINDIDYVLLTHLDCDHANGLGNVKDAKHILVSNAELKCAGKPSPVVRIRYNAKWWRGCRVEGFDWNGTDGPFGRSYDLFGDGSVKLINIPGHSDGLCAVKLTNSEGKFVLLYSDGGYSSHSWQELIASGISMDKTAQRRSLEWIREQSLSPDCVESLANHDPDIVPHTIEL